MTPDFKDLYMLRRHFFFFFLFVTLLTGVSQTTIKPTAKFSFNYGGDDDEINKRKAKLVGVSYTLDRFGNDKCAIFIAGNEYSYINLGTSVELKPKVGSISLWVKLEHEVWSGTGAKYSPIIITKCNPSDDFYESYVIYYMLESKRIVAVAAKDSTRDFGLFGAKKFERNAWII
jgi:hypothetical protein